MRPFMLCGVVILLLVGAQSVAADAVYPRAEMLVEPTTLTTNAAAKFVVLDARDEKSFLAGHIPGAVLVDHTAWAKAFGDGKDTRAWSERIGGLGIDGKTPVVVYDDNLAKDAARVWWILRYWGVKDVRLLNGGWRGWTKTGAQPATGAASAKAARFAAESTAKRLATKDQLLSALKTGGLQILDARSHAEFCGDEAMTNKRAGAMPGAKNLEWSDLIDKPSQRFKSSDELTKLFQAAGVSLDKPIAAHCQSGGRASVMAFGLELMGAKDVSNYYKSWAEWGNATDTPIVQPKKE